MTLIPTASQTAGPYVHLGLTEKWSVGRIAGEAVNGERLWMTCRICDGDGIPVPDAVIEIWQADARGQYRHPEDTRPAATDPAWRGFGRLAVDENGTCIFETIKPGRVPGRGDTLQAPHLNVSIFARGLLKQLVTRIYFAGEKANAEDAVLALVPEKRRETLMAHPDTSRTGGWGFEIRLCGEGETVFFEV
jgi:protocatechuate 3,4-dioxygenase, alpha subunit